MSAILTKLNYQQLFDTMLVLPKYKNALNRIATIVKGNKSRYEGINILVQKVYPGSHIPWQFIACTHLMECNLRFDLHLHNGDTLQHRTINVPIGRPVKGTPPFSFEQSAVDALEYQGLHLESDWSISNMLYKLEGYNGYGYQHRGINSPYLWSYSNHYGAPPNIGKYTFDGHFDAKAISQQLGAAVLLKAIF